MALTIFLLVSTVCVVILTYYLTIAVKDLSATLRSVKILADDIDDNIKDVNMARNTVKLGILRIASKIFGRR